MSPDERVERDLPIADGRELAGEQIARRAVQPRGPVEIDDADLRAGLQGRDEVVQEGEGLGDLVVHVDEQRDVDRGRRQARVVRLAEAEGDVGQPLLAHPAVEAGEVVRHHVLRQHAPGRADHLREADRVVAGARADVGDRHAGPDPEMPRELPRLVDLVALLLRRPDRADDLGHGPVGRREVLGGRAGGREGLDRRLGGGGCRGRAKGRRKAEGRRERSAVWIISAPRPDGSLRRVRTNARTMANDRRCGSRTPSDRAPRRALDPSASCAAPRAPRRSVVHRPGKRRRRGPTRSCAGTGASRPSLRYDPLTSGGPMQRRLAAIMVADIVGYSTLMEEAEERTAARAESCQDLIKAEGLGAGGPDLQHRRRCLAGGVRQPRQRAALRDRDP